VTTMRMPAQTATVATGGGGAYMIVREKVSFGATAAEPVMLPPATAIETSPHLTSLTVASGVATTSNPDGSQFVEVIDSNGVTTSTTGPGGTTTIAYDSVGKTLAMATPFQTKIYAYDIHGELAQLVMIDVATGEVDETDFVRDY